MSIPIKTLTLPISSGGSTTETEYSFITPEDMAEKANVDGYYENLVSGGTEQILSSVYEEDSEPYLFRTSGGSIDIGDREEDTIVGGTIAWNQLQANTKSYSSNGVTYTFNNGKLTIATASGGATSNSWWLSGNDNKWSWINNHVYFVDVGNSNYTATPGAFPHWYIPTSPSLNLYKDKNIIKITNNTQEMYLQFTVYSGNEINMTFTPQVFDLTQMFGSTIADYIYSLEQANAGAGVAWFKKLFPKPYYAYNAGELLSVEGLTSHDTVGFNAWDEEWELGGISTSTGENISSSGNSRTKNYIPVIPSATYYFKSPVTLGLRFYDADKNIIKNYALSANSTYTMPSNCRFLRFVMVGVTQYANDICINLHWDGERDGEYEPYVKHSYPLDDSLTLRGIPKLDSNNKLYYDGDVYEADGTVTRKYGIVDLGSLTWSYQSGNARFQSSSLSGIIKESTRNHLSTKYQYGSTTTVDKTIQIGANSNVYIKDSAYTDAATFKTAMSGVYLVYELQTETTEEAEPYTNPQIVDDFGTEEYVTDSIVPVGHVTKYMPNLKAKLEMAPDSPSDNGDYIVRHTNGLNEYVPLVIPTELPTTPSEDGTYHLKVTVTNGTAVLSWEGE